MPTRALLALFCHFEIAGTEHLRGIPRAIFAANHASELDPIIVTAALSPLGRFAPLFYVVAPYHDFKHKRYGWRQHIYTPTFFKAWGAYAAERGHRDYSKSLQRHIRLARDGRSMCLFPEGGIARDGVHHKAHGGVAFLSAASNTPVIPVSIQGSHRLGISDFLGGKRRVRVRFGRPLYPRDLFDNPEHPKVEDCTRAARLIMDNVTAGLA